MPRYIVQRTFPEACTSRSMGAGLTCALAPVVERNAEEGVTWISSFVSDDKTRTFCVYDAHSRGDPQGRHRQRATDRPDHAGSCARPPLLRPGQPTHQRGHHVHVQQARTGRRCDHHAPVGRQIRHIGSGSPPKPS